MRLENLDKGPKDIEMGAENPINEKEEENHDENESKFLDADRSWTIQHVSLHALEFGMWNIHAYSDLEERNQMLGIQHLKRVYLKKIASPLEFSMSKLLIQGQSSWANAVVA